MAEDHSDSIAIVWPSEYPDDPKSHCTIIYLGKIADVGFSYEDVIFALEDIDFIAMSARPIGLDLFGEDKDIPVILLNSSLLKAYQWRVTYELSKIDIRSASEFTDYKPHITVKTTPVPFEEVPPIIQLSLPELWWGNEHLKIVSEDTLTAA